MMKYCFVVFMIASFCATAQDAIDMKKHADCETRLEIPLRRLLGPYPGPEGSGQVLEFSENDPESLHFIEKEHHTVWYEFITKIDADFVFDLEPLNSLDDYDFALYKYTDTNFCREVQTKKILPIRSNFSRNKLEVAGRTGLSFEAKDAHVSSGVNPARSQSVETKAGEKYVLLVDNVYGGKAGHLLHFDLAKFYIIEGTVVDDESEKPLNAKVVLHDLKTGELIAETKTDAHTGNYELEARIKMGALKNPMSLQTTTKEKGYFFADTIFAFAKIPPLKNIKCKQVLSKIRKDKVLRLNNILFVGNSPQPLLASYPILKLLHKTMRINASLEIKIEGHTNGCGSSIDCDWLSDARSKTVVNYLEENGIELDRMDQEGFSDQYLLHDIRSKEAYLNRRVEIRIVEP